MTRERAHRAYGEGRLFQRGGVWWVDYHVHGRRYRESSGSKEKADAVRLLKRRLGDAVGHRFIGPDAEKVTFADLRTLLRNHYRVNARRSAKRADHALDHLAAYFGTWRALAIGARQLEAYIAMRLEGDAARATVRYELAILRKAFRLARAQSILPNIPTFPTLTVANARQGFFERADLDALVRSLSLPIADVLTFAYLTGWRIPSEVLPLTWDRVDLVAGVVRLDVGSTKNADGRTFPVDVLPELRGLLERRRALTDQLETGTAPIPWVFHRAGRPIRDFREAWRRALVKAKLPADRVPHDFRRSAVRNLERAGVARSVAMQLTGHKTEAVYRRYAIVVEKDLREGVAKLAALHHSDKAEVS